MNETTTRKDACASETGLHDAQSRRAWSRPRLQSADIKALTAARNNSGTDFLGRIPFFPGTPFKGR